MPSARSLSSVQNHVRRLNPAIVAMRRGLAARERYTADELRDYQEKRLRALVRWASLRSPFYRRWFGEAGVDPKSIRTLADLERLPVIDRADLAERPGDFLAAPERLVWASHSSGTSGTPVTVYRSAGSSIFELACLQRQWGWFGIPARPRSVELRGSTFAGDDPSVVTTENPGANRLLVSSFRLSAANLPAIRAAITAFRPQTVEGWPSSLSLLASLLRDAGLRLPVRGVITSSELMSSAQRALMGEVFQAPVVNHYGQTERAVMAGGCEHGTYHLFPDYGILELHPVEDAPAERRVVGTPLHNFAFPLLRYRTDDRVSVPSDEPCPCGRAFPASAWSTGAPRSWCGRPTDGRCRWPARSSTTSPASGRCSSSSTAQGCSRSGWSRGRATTGRPSRPWPARTCGSWAAPRTPSRSASWTPSPARPAGSSAWSPSSTTAAWRISAKPESG